MHGIAILVQAVIIVSSDILGVIWLSIHLRCMTCMVGCVKSGYRGVQKQKQIKTNQQKTAKHLGISFM